MNYGCEVRIQNNFKTLKGIAIVPTNERDFLSLRHSVAYVETGSVLHVLPG